MHQLQDASLAELIKKPESRNSAFERLLDLYQKRLYWHIRKIVISHEDASDILQESFIKVWNSLDSFKGNSSLYTWIFRIATNEALGFLRKKRNRFFTGIQNLESELATEMIPDGNELSQKLHKAILRLPEKQRIVFNMKYFDEMRYEDMAEILSTSEGALKASYHHAVKKIEKMMMED